jgi:hypothetical protein
MSIYFSLLFSFLIDHSNNLLEFVTLELGNSDIIAIGWRDKASKRVVSAELAAREMLASGLSAASSVAILLHLLSIADTAIWIWCGRQLYTMVMYVVSVKENVYSHEMLC